MATHLRAETRGIQMVFISLLDAFLPMMIGLDDFDRAFLRADGRRAGPAPRPSISPLIIIRAFYHRPLYGTAQTPTLLLPTRLSRRGPRDVRFTLATSRKKF